MPLGPGSIEFIGVNTNGTDWFAFVAIEPIAAGQAIYFTDNELPNANSTSFNGSPTGGESYTKWVAPAEGVAAGTVVNVSSFYAAAGVVTVDVGTASQVTFTGSNNTGLSNGSDSLYAYLADGDATVDTPTAHLAFINIGTTVDPAPASLSANETIRFNAGQDSAYYTGSHSDQTTFAGYLAEIANPANWTLGAGSTDNSNLNAAPFTLDTPPTLVSSNPADNAANVSPASDIVLTFSENVAKGTGNILIRDLADNSVVQTIDVTSTAVSITNNVVTINPPADLAANHSYYLEIDPTALKDTTNNNFAGISNPTALNFTTAASESQTVDFATVSVAQHEGQTGTTDFTFTLERIGGATGDLNFSGTFASANTDDADYTGGKPVSFSGTIVDGQSTGTVTIHVAGDKVVEDDENFTLTLDTLSNTNSGIAVSLGANTGATGTIQNDDGFIVHTGQTVTATQTLADGNSGIVETGGALAVPGAVAVTWTGGAVAIDNAGTISANTRVIDTGASVLPDSSNLHVTNETGGHLLAATNDVIRINSDMTNGTITIDNSGWIISGQVDNAGNISGTQGGQALDFNNIADASDHTTINNFAGGIIGSAAEDGMRPGVNATINNYGLIIGKDGEGAATKSDGIDGQTATGITIHNLAGGTIDGARHGVTGNFPITVINDAGATIIGHQGSGLNMDTAPDTTVSVVNHGTITGTATGVNDGDGIDVDGLIALDNYGTISAVGHSAGEVNEGLAIGGGTINNFASGTIYSQERAITVDDSNLGNAFGATTINNEGTIQSDIGQAISITDTFADTITNNGDIFGSIKTGGGDDNFANFGTNFRNVPFDAPPANLVDMGDGNDVLSNSGAIENQSGVAIVMGGGDDTLTNSGEVVAGNDVAIDMGDGNDTVENSGHVTGAIDMGAGNDVFVGSIDNNVPIFGGTGDDTFYLDVSTAQVIENAGEGFDQIFTSVDFELTPGSEIEILWAAAGTTGLTLVGNELDNGIVGGVGHDTLIGNEGNDTLVSQGLSDTMAGGIGDDTYYVNNSDDFVTENISEGHDQVFATVDYTLTAGSEVEVLWAAAGTNGVTLTGNELDNGIVGGAGHDTLNGGGGNDTLVSQGLSDTMAGGTGDDTYYVNNSADVVTENAGEGHDQVFASVDFTLTAGSEVEVLWAAAGTNGLTLTGNELDNGIVGGAGHDTLNGGGGNDTLVSQGLSDTMAGGAGDDTYYVNNSADVVKENAGGGHDQVYSSVDYTLTADSDVEVLSAAAGTNGLTLTGNFHNFLGCVIVGGDGHDTLIGSFGDDTLVSQGASDTMAGGDSGDTYYVNNSADIIIEHTGSGNDQVFTSVDYTLQTGSEVEWLRANAATGLTLTGNEFKNSIVGGVGNDTLNGRAGADDMFGGAGNDQFQFNLGEANGDRVRDFTAGDHLDFFGYGTAASGATLTEVGNTDSWVITPDAGHGGAAAAETVVLNNVFALNPTDYLFH